MRFSPNRKWYIMGSIIIIILSLVLLTTKTKKFIPDNQLQPTDTYGNKSVIPNSQDWVKIVQAFSIIDDNEIQFSDGDFDLASTFSLGDKLRYEVDGTERYAYVGQHSDSNLVVYTSTDNDFGIGNAVTNLYISKIATPSGHPIIFTNQSTFADGDIRNTPIDRVTAGKLGVDWFMIGPAIKLIGSTTGNANESITQSVAATILRIDFPWLKVPSGADPTDFVSTSSQRPILISGGAIIWDVGYITTRTDGGKTFLMLQVVTSNSETNFGVDFEAMTTPYDPANL